MWQLYGEFSIKREFWGEFNKIMQLWKVNILPTQLPNRIKNPTCCVMDVRTEVRCFPIHKGKAAIIYVFMSLLMAISTRSMIILCLFGA